ncbi:MAG: hypothetical protein JRN09_03685 [Nitrososphaerota archaeon]|nr:hypothetical protein [Nitrososphaerota archaeon]
MSRSRGVSTFVATLLLVSISLSLSFVVYEGVSRFAPPQQNVYTNQVIQVGGPEGLVEVLVNSSSAGSPLAFQAGGASSQTGVLYFNGTAYGTTDKLCKTGATTFFAIHTGSGVLSTGGNGRAWIDGQWTSSLAVQPGWHEVMFAGASSCTVTEPDGQVVVYPSGTVSTVPLIGTLPSSRFELYVPTGGSAGPFLMVFDGSYDRIA